IVGSLALRSLLAFFMISHIDSFLLFPEAFGVLVLQKAYHVAKSALVPTMVPSDDALVDANSKLSLTAAISGMSGAAVGALFATLGGSSWAAAVAMIVFAIAVFQALSLPKVSVASQPIGETEKAELRSGTIVLAASVVAVLRAVVGFVTFLLAFELRGGGDGVNLEPIGAGAGAFAGMARGLQPVIESTTPLWHFGVVVACAGVGALLGARIAPVLRRQIPEERLVLGSLGLTVFVAAVAVWQGTALVSGALVAFGVAVSAATAKLAFDSLVQRDAPAVNYGATFARFEARFQLSWVAGAFLPVAIKFSGSGVRFGYLIVVLVGVIAGLFYFFGARMALGARLSRLASAMPRRGAGDGPIDVSATAGSGGPSTTVMDSGSGDPAGPTRQLHWPQRGEAPAPTQVMPATRSGDTGPPPKPPSPPRRSAPTAPNWGAPSGPHVSSVDGVEVDE
ncbi:MAG: hypothetical protein HKN26_01460, partial [Acidimicrobiales bacterium]|nr:hypothetical protein [Acidimicrobiales bacterium]